MKGHTDAVWSMILVDDTLVSISADSTIRVWKPFATDESDSNSLSSVKCFNESTGKQNHFKSFFSRLLVKLTHLKKKEFQPVLILSIMKSLNLLQVLAAHITAFMILKHQKKFVDSTTQIRR